MYWILITNRHLIAIATLITLCLPAFAQTHLDIMVPALKDTDLSGPVKSVDTKVSINVSGKFEREHQEYDRSGNLLSETEWNSDGECTGTQTNYYDADGNFERELYIDYEDAFTNNWTVMLNPDTCQIAMKEKKIGAVAVYTYSPAGYLINYRYMDRKKTLKSAFSIKRDEQNRRMEYTRIDGKKKPLYTYWFKWKEDDRIDRERQRYRQEKKERLHTYEYLAEDDHGNWTQQVMVRYDITDKEKVNVFEKISKRTIEYYEKNPTENPL